jgi:SAM-dependent methyltransferase
LGFDHTRWFAEPMRHLGDRDPALHGILAPASAGDAMPAGVTAQFLEHAGDYHARYANVAHFRVLLDDALARLDPPLAPRTILDIGSGSGNSVVPLLDRFGDASVVATDISAPLLAILRDELATHPGFAERCTLARIDADDARYQRNAFDLVVGAAILHHVMTPDHVLDTCAAALGPGGAAIFFEPFELGHALRHVAYRDLLAEADRRGDHAPGFVMLRRLVEDYARRTAGDALQALDDKWMFTRGFFEQAAKRGAWAECHVYATHDIEAPLTHETRVNLRLGMGLEPSALPQWAWERLSEHERVLSPAARREAMFEGAIVLRRSNVERATPARAAWWLDPAAPGQGYFIELRDGDARIVCCVYDAAGRPVWHAGHARVHGDGVVLSTRALAFSDDGSRDPHVGELELAFAADGDARLRWASVDRHLALQHTGTPGWAATPASALGGCWIEDAETPAVAAVVEYLDQRLFAALLGKREWCVTSATRRGPDHYAGEWLRYSGGQAVDGPYRPPAAPQRLGDARLWWTPGGRLLIEAPDGRQRVLRRWTARESDCASGLRPNWA